MPEITLSTLLQLVVGIELLLVWVVRARWATSFRGGDAKTLKEEFATYGLPEWFFYLVGAFKIPAAIFLLVGVLLPEVVLPAAAVIVTKPLFREDFPRYEPVISSLDTGDETIDIDLTAVDIDETEFLDDPEFRTNFETQFSNEEK